MRESAFQFDPTVNKREPKEDVGLLVAKNLVELKARIKAEDPHQQDERERLNAGQRDECSSDSSELPRQALRRQAPKQSVGDQMRGLEAVDSSEAFKHTNSKSQVGMKELIRNKLMAKRQAIQDKRDAESLRVQGGRQESGVAKQQLKQQRREDDKGVSNANLASRPGPLDQGAVGPESRRNCDQPTAKDREPAVQEEKDPPATVENKKLMKFLSNLKMKTTDKNDPKCAESVKDSVPVNGNSLEENSKAQNTNLGVSGLQEVKDRQTPDTLTASLIGKESNGEPQGRAFEDSNDRPVGQQRDAGKQHRIPEGVKAEQTAPKEHDNDRGNLQGPGVEEEQRQRERKQAKPVAKQPPSFEIRETKQDASQVMDLQMEAEQLQREVSRVMSSAQLAAKSQPSHNSLSSRGNKAHRLTTEEYESMVAKLSTLNLVDLRQFVTRPSQKHQLIQCMLVRDRSGLINKFYPVFHLFFSVSSEGGPEFPLDECATHARQQVQQLLHLAVHEGLLEGRGVVLGKTAVELHRHQLHSVRLRQEPEELGGRPAGEKRTMQHPLRRLKRRRTCSG